MSVREVLEFICNITNPGFCLQMYVHLIPANPTRITYVSIFSILKSMIPEAIFDVIDTLLHSKFELRGVNNPVYYVEAQFYGEEFASEEVYESDSTEIANAIAQVLVRGGLNFDPILDENILDQVIDTHF
jgi:hypothetical protein